MKKYLKVWLIMTGNSIQTILSSRLGVIIFTFGKFFRFSLFIIFIFFLFSGINNVVGYGRYQTLFFFVTFSTIGAIGQMLFRETYRFRARLVAGDFDFDLLKPIHPLLRNLSGGFDVLDLLTLPVYFWVLIDVVKHLSFGPDKLFLYILLSLNGLVIMAAIHVVVIAFGIVTTEVDHAVMIYRDFEAMARFPVDIYREPLKQILTFALPVGIMFTLPAKAFLGLLSWQAILACLFVGVVSICLAFYCWNFAVKKYSSASS